MSSKILTFGSHSLANFQPMLEFALCQNLIKLEYDHDLKNIKTDCINIVIFNLHQIKCLKFFGTPGISVLAPENDYKNTALQISGKSIIKSVYCMLFKSQYIVLYAVSEYLEFHSALYQLISFYSGLPQIQNDLHTN